MNTTPCRTSLQASKEQLRISPGLQQHWPIPVQWAHSLPCWPPNNPCSSRPTFWPTNRSLLLLHVLKGFSRPGGGASFSLSTPTCSGNRQREHDLSGNDHQRPALDKASAMCCHQSDHDKMIMHILAGCTADLTQLLSRPLMSCAMQGTLEHRPAAVPLSEDVSHRSKQLCLSSCGAAEEQPTVPCNLSHVRVADDTAKAKRRLLSNACCELLLRHCHPSFFATMTHNMLI
jgi:hypothetical protein